MKKEKIIFFSLRIFFCDIKYRLKKRIKLMIHKL